jgi:hypothetical protein
MVNENFNPFTPSFGSEPLFFAGRTQILEAVSQGIVSNPGSPYRSTILVGPRGCGKTVLLTKISERLELSGWLSVNVSDSAGSGNLLKQIIRQAYSKLAEYLPPKSKKQLTGVGAYGFSLDWENAKDEDFDFRIELSKIADTLASVNNGYDDGIGICITVDELDSKDRDLIQLISDYQHFVREHKKVALLMAGLPGKVLLALRDDDISFLRRAFQVQLEPILLEETAIAMRKTFEAGNKHIAEKDVAAAAEATGGYPYMIQLVGFYIWEQAAGKENIETVDVADGVRIAQAYLERTVYDVTFRELRANDIKFLAAMAGSSGVASIAGIREASGIAKGSIYKTRDRLIAQGLITDEGQGRLAFAMPALREYVVER